MKSPNLRVPRRGRLMLGVATAAALAFGSASCVPPSGNTWSATSNSQQQKATTAKTTVKNATPRIGNGSFVPAFRDDFTGGSINGKVWGIYNGGPGKRAKVNAVVHNGMLTLYSRKVNGKWTGAGISSGGRQLFTYGKFEFRAKLQRGTGTRAVALLWPAHGWPPEIDYFEMWDGNRNRDILTNHYSPANHMQHNFITADFTQWHTIGLEWTPAAITYLLDGKVVAVQKGHVPHQPMWMGFQTTAGGRGMGKAPNASTPSSVAWDIDYIQAWHYR